MRLKGTDCRDDGLQSTRKKFKLFGQTERPDIGLFPLDSMIDKPMKGKRVGGAYVGGII